MNKKIFTLLTAFLLMAGALFSNANAAVTYTAAAGDLKEGLKVYLGNAAGSAFLASSQIGTSGNYTFVTGSDAEAFTVTGLKKENGKNLFKLVNAAGKTIYGKIGATYVEAAAAADVTAGTCWFSADDAAGNISLDEKPLTYDMANANNVAVMLIATETFDAAKLNANLSGKGFAFAFPNAVSEADVNPFAGNMVAVDASTVQTALTTAAVGTGTYTDGLCFVKADAAGLAYLAATDNGDKAKAATFVVLNPQANFGITGLTVASGEGFGFTTVKGSKLAENNKNADGKIAFANAVYKVSEDDSQNAAGEYTIEIAAGAKVKSDSEENTATTAAVYVGAYSLTTGGIKTYITTVLTAKAGDLSLAMTSNNTWAKASDLLSATDATIVNISFLGTKPTNDDEAKESLYGEYLVPVYGAANFTAAAAAPEDVDVNAPLSQWVISAVSGHDFTFTNRETNVTFKTSLYKTEKAGEYLIGTASMTDANATAITTVTGGVTGDLATITNWGGQTIKLTATTVSEGFMALTDAQLEQVGEVVFNGDGVITVDKVYMTYDATNKFSATKDATKSIAWLFEKGEAVKNKMEYAYLKDDAVAQKDSVVVTAPSYLLYQKVDGDKKYFDALNAVLGDKDNAFRCYFKKNVDETYALIMIDKTAKTTDADKYAEVVKGAATKYSVKTSDATFVNTVKLNETTEYSNVTVEFNSFTESLESVARHATLDSEDGSVSMKLNKNGIVEGIIAGEGMTFWLDTADIDQEIPTFYISKGNGEDARSFLFYATDSLTYWDAASATYKTNEIYYLEGANKTDMKAIFRPAAIAAIDTISTTVDGEAVLVAEKEKEDVCLGGVKNFKFYIMKAGETSYYIRSVNGGDYLYNLNGKLGFTDEEEKALVITLGEGDATSNEDAPAVSTVQVVAGEGNVTIAGAAGKKVVISNILGQVVANTVLSSDNATIAAPAGVVVVAVEGEAAVKAIVK